jgi:hypothetical protein
MFATLSLDTRFETIAVTTTERIVIFGLNGSLASLFRARCKGSKPFRSPGRCRSKLYLRLGMFDRLLAVVTVRNAERLPGSVVLSAKAEWSTLTEASATKHLSSGFSLTRESPSHLALLYVIHEKQTNRIALSSVTRLLIFCPRHSKP